MMRHRMALFGLMCGVCIADLAAAQPCATPLSASARVRDFDAFGWGFATDTFTLRLRARGEEPGRVFVQLIDPGGGPGSAIGGGPGPFEVIAVASSVNLIAGAAQGSAPSALGAQTDWAEIASFDRGGGRLDLQVRVAQGGTANAGEFRSQLGVRVACGRSDGGFDVFETQSVVDVSVRVRSEIFLGANATTLDFGEFASSGAPAMTGGSVPIRATGPFDVEIRSRNGPSTQDVSGVLRREGGGRGPEDEIPYRLSIGGVDAIQQRRLSCSADAAGLRLMATTDPAPARGKAAGKYADTVTITFTPALGPKMPVGCGAAR